MFGLSIGKLVFYGVVVLAILGTVYYGVHAIYKAGWEARDADFQAFKKEQIVKTVEVEKIVEKIVTVVETEVVERVRVVKEKGETIVKEVPVYVTKTDDAACELRNGFVRVHDAATRNSPPGPATELDRDPSGIALSEALQAVADNYARYHACREQVIGWNKFWESYGKALKGAVCVPNR